MGKDDGERGDTLHQCGHSYDRRGKKTKKKQKTLQRLCIYTLWLRPKTRSSFAGRLQSVCSLQEMTATVSRKKKKKNYKKMYNPPQGNDLCDVGILNEGEDIHNICHIGKKRESNSSIFFFNLPPVECLRRPRRHHKVPYLATPMDA